MKRLHHPLVVIVMLAAALAAVPGAAEAQPADRVYKIGLLAPGDPARSPHLQAFFDALRQLGWVEGWNIAVERRYWESRPDRQPALAGELGLTIPRALLARADQVIE